MSTPRMIVDVRSILSLVLTLAAMVFTIFPLKLKIKGRDVMLNFATVPPVVAVILCVTTLIQIPVLIRGLLGPISPTQYVDKESNSGLIPISVIALFFGLAYTCVSANVSGLFKEIAEKFKKLALKSKNKRLAALIYFFIFALIFATCTNNDIVVLCLTPVIMEFVAQTNDPVALVPMLVCQFAATHTFSMCLLTGNPSNFILTSVFQMDFYQYLLAELPVGASCGLLTLGLGWLLLRRDASKAKRYVEFGAEQQIPAQLQRRPPKFNLVFSSAVLAAMFVLFLLSPVLKSAVPGFELSYIAVLTAITQLVKDIVLHRRKVIKIQSVSQGLPWGVPLFLVSMFILVENAISIGLIGDVARVLAGMLANQPAILFTACSAVLTSLACVLFNNLPGTIIVARIFNDRSFAGLKATRAAALAAAAASNYGAMFLPHCSLAGLMWSQLIGHKELQGRIWRNLAAQGAVCLVVGAVIGAFM